MSGSVKLVFHTKEVTKSIEDAASKRMYEATNLVRTSAMETLSGSRTGRTYKVPGTNRTYTASAPGEPPAQATGELRQNVKTEVESENKTLYGYVGTDKKQGLFTEFGTINMKARPWLLPSFEKVLPQIKKLFGGRWF